MEPKNHYAKKSDLIEQITKSKAIRKKYPKRSPSECLTPKLIDMIEQIVYKFGELPNWRNYCVDETTECLTRRGWTTMDDLSTDDMILSSKDGILTWSKVKSVYRGNFDGNMFHMTSRGFDALVTPGHKFLTTEGIKPVELLRERDKLVMMSQPVENSQLPEYDDAFVELVGWTITEGNYHRPTDRNYTRVIVHQNEGKKANRIRACLEILKSKHGETYRSQLGHTLIGFTLSKEMGNRLINVAPNRVPTLDFILSLSQTQREILINTMVDADGWRAYGKYMNYGQVCKDHVDAFIVLCTLAGYRTSTRLKEPNGYGKKPFHVVRIFTSRTHHNVVEKIDFHGGKNSNRVIGEDKSHYPNYPTVPYRGRVWCPETEFGVFVARRNGFVYLTGNSYIEDMKSSAVMAVCHNALKFDPEKSNEPFNYYTMIANRTFLTFIEAEKKQRDIRDDLIEAHSFTGHMKTAGDANGIKTSFARQSLHETTQLGPSLDGTRRIPVKRGRFRRRKSTVLDGIPLHTIDSEPPPVIED